MRNTASWGSVGAGTYDGLVAKSAVHRHRRPHNQRAGHRLGIFVDQEGLGVSVEAVLLIVEHAGVVSTCGRHGMIHIADALGRWAVAFKAKSRHRQVPEAGLAWATHAGIETEVILRGSGLLKDEMRIRRHGCGLQEDWRREVENERKVPIRERRSRRCLRGGEATATEAPRIHAWQESWCECSNSSHARISDSTALQDIKKVLQGRKEFLNSQELC